MISVSNVDLMRIQVDVMKVDYEDQSDSVCTHFYYIICSIFPLFPSLQVHKKRKKKKKVKKGKASITQVSLLNGRKLYLEKLKTKRNRKRVGSNQKQKWPKKLTNLKLVTWPSIFWSGLFGFFFSYFIMVLSFCSVAVQVIFFEVIIL